MTRRRESEVAGFRDIPGTIVISTFSDRGRQMHVSPEEFGRLLVERIDNSPEAQEAVMAWDNYRRARNQRRSQDAERARESP